MILPNRDISPHRGAVPWGPPGGVLHLIMQHRFLVVSLVVVLFLGSLFAWGARHGGSTPAKSAEPAVAVVPHGGPAPVAPKELELKPLVSPPAKGAHEAVPRSRPAES